ncbi:DUF3997 domain-containing protein [uncultured Aquimarina sp.]|uniref:DUF3997 domain-containing protein n=1 Tax=uncultured Aquimarina sp. TaxID=575652 RepID=UPI0026240820|nr:DUF3997 domain-containing protein [uncultured Aquimarina sp.]
MRNITKLILILGILTLNSCYLFDSDSDKIIGKYEVQWVDIPNKRAICERYSTTVSSVLIPEYVFAVGHNSEFIIAKQHPTNGFEKGYQIDTSKTNYYIIDIREKSDVLGPLNLLDFNKKISELNITKIDFDQVYPDDI